MSVARDLRTLLRLRNFRRLLTVRLLSQSADGVYQVALAAYVVFSPEKQATASAVASAMAVLLLPYSLIGPFAGYCWTAGPDARSSSTGTSCGPPWPAPRRC